MKRLMFAAALGGICIYATAATAAEDWKVLTIVKKTKDTYYYDAASVKKKKGKVSATTKFESGKGETQKAYMEVDCAKKKYRFLKPAHEWQEFSHASPMSVLHAKVCKDQEEGKVPKGESDKPLEQQPSPSPEGAVSPQPPETR